MATIKAVTFDLWQTLLLDRAEMGRTRTQARLDGTRQALLAAGHDFHPRRIEEAYWSGVRHCQGIRDGGKDVSFQEQVRIYVNSIASDLYASIPQSTFLSIAAAYADSFLDYPASPHPEGVTVLREIREMGLAIGLISNTGMTPGVLFRRFLAEHGMLEYFDVLTFSDEVGYSKPSSEVFDITLEKLGTTPSQTIHVGDHVFNDVAAAKANGFKTVWIEGFYERPDPDDPATEPDITVANLGESAAAIRKIMLGSPAS